MTSQEIKDAVDNGKTVQYGSGYEVIKFKNDYFIRCRSNAYTIGLTWSDGVTLNGKEEDFFIVEPEPEEEFPCLIITTLIGLKTRTLFDMLEGYDIVADSFDHNQLIFGLEGMMIGGTDVYRIFEVFNENHVNMDYVKFTIENRTM
jgi:hypothetical protein